MAHPPTPRGSGRPAIRGMSPAPRVAPHISLLRPPGRGPGTTGISQTPFQLVPNLYAIVERCRAWLLLTCLDRRSSPPVLSRPLRSIISTPLAKQNRPRSRETPSVSAWTIQAEPFAEPPRPAD